MVVSVRTPGGPFFQEDLSDDQDLPCLCMASSPSLWTQVTKLRTNPTSVTASPINTFLLRAAQRS